MRGGGGHIASFKVNAELKDDKTLAEQAEKFDVQTSQISKCERQLQEAATEVFLALSENRQSVGPRVKDVQAKIGQRALGNDLWVGTLGRIGETSAKG